MSRSVLFALAVLIFASGCPDEEDDGLITCGPGTVLADGECRPEGTDPLACGPGTIRSGDRCEPDPAICRPGTTFDSASGGCVPDVACRQGEVAVNGFCLTPEEIDASMADAMESSPDDNDPRLGGTPEPLTTPPVGASVVFTGTIELREEQDWDHWGFDATSGDAFEIVLRSLGSSELGFVITGPNGYRRLSPLYFQAEPSRRVVLPHTGRYTIAVAPQIAIEQITDAGPVGGDEHRYVVVLEHEPFFTAADLALGAEATGELYDLSDNLHRILAPAGAMLRVEIETSAADAVPAVLRFDGAGRFLEEIAATELALVHAAAAGDDLMVLMDWVRLVGDRDAYSVRTVPISPSDVGTVAPDSTATSSTIAIGGGAAGYFVATVSAGQVLEVVVSGGATPPDLRVIAPDGTAANTVLDARETRFYAATGGRYTLEITSNDAGAGEFSIALASVTPVLAGPLAVTGTTSAAWPFEVGPAERAYFVVSAAEPLSLEVMARQAGNANLSLGIHDLEFDALRFLPLGGTAPRLTAFLTRGGGAIVEVLNSSAVTPAVDLEIELGASALPPLEVEPNDGPELATPLSIDAPLLGEIEALDTDYFRITLAEPLQANELLELRARDPNDTDDYICQLLSRTGAVIEEQAPRRRGCLIVAGGLAAGIHHFVLHKSEPVPREYQVEATILSAVREREPNDSAPGNVITDLTGAVPTYGEVALNTDTDVFGFVLADDLAGDEILMVRTEVVGTNPTGAMQFNLQGPGGLNSTLPVVPAATMIRAGAPAGEYRARITRSSGVATFDGHYRVTVESGPVSVVEAEPNDEAAAAQPLGELPGSALGAIGEPTLDDDDWFSFVLPQDLAPEERLHVELHRIGVQPTEALRLAIFDESLSLLGSSGAGDPRLVTRIGAGAGTYYVRVDATFATTIDTDYLLVVRTD